MEVLYSIIMFIFGTIMGSFYNVVGYRLPNNMSLSKPGSHCPACNHPLGFFDLFPILSYVFMGGKCRYCKKKIPLFYPFFECLTGILFVICFLIFGLKPELLVALTFTSILLIVILSDYKYMIIPDELILFGLVSLFIQRIAFGLNVWSAILDILLSFVGILIIKIGGDALFKKESLGGGDVKLLPIFGIVIGWQMALFSIFIASFIALPISLWVLYRNKTNVIPFGPFLSIGALLIYYFQIDYSYVINLLIGS